VNIRAEIGFLEFFQKPPGSHAWPARRHKHQTHFLGIIYEPPGGGGWTARRHEHCGVVFGCFGPVWGTYDVVVMLNVWMWILRIWLTVYMMVMLEGMIFDLKLGVRVLLGVGNNYAC